MVENISASLIDWSRAQFALTAMYHWIFVPLTLGLAVIMGIMETVYYKTGDEKWKQTAKFWMKLFGINFAIGVATGIILEFQFGTNWSNYSWLVGDIFGAPLAIEGILAFFMEATFIAVMFFGWNKVGKGLHLASTWLTGLGATISAWWILVANAWMQHPVGMAFNPDTMRNEMQDFFAVATSSTAVVKFFHTVTSGWILGALFAAGVSCYFLLKKKNTGFALRSIKVSAAFGLVASLIALATGDSSGYDIAKHQPMKLAAVEGLYEGGNGMGLTAVGILNPGKESYDDGEDPFLLKMDIPCMLSLLATREADGYVPGINNLIEGGYTLPDGTKALSAEEKMEKGREAIASLAAYRKAVKENDTAAAQAHRATLEENMPYFGYGYIKDKAELIPNVPLNFYAFRIMVMLGGLFIVYFIAMLFLAMKKKIEKTRWMHYIALALIPLGYIAGQAGWIVAETGRQPWTIQDMLPVSAAISGIETSSVKITFFIFLLLFTVMLAAGITIMCKEIKKGPETYEQKQD